MLPGRPGHQVFSGGWVQAEVSLFVNAVPRAPSCGDGHPK